MFNYRREDLFNPVLTVLRQRGGSATVDKIVASVKEILNISDADAAEIHVGTTTKLQYLLAWTRTHLKSAGLIDNPKRGSWSLTVKGEQVGELSPEQIIEVARSTGNKTDQGVSALSDETLIAQAQSDLQDFLKSKATKSKTLELGFPGGSGSVLAHWFEDLDMWIGCSESADQNRYWNALGFGSPFEKKSPNIIVEFNPHKSKFNGHSRAVFLTMGDSETTYLAHSGGIGGGKKGVGKTAFLKSFKVDTVNVEGRSFISIGEIGSDSFLRNMREFAIKVRDFKASVPSKSGKVKENNEEPVIPNAPIYDREQLLKETLIDGPITDAWLRAIQRKRRAVFYGPPGTGKSFLVERLAKHIVQDSPGIIDIVQFHPSYTYEEFIQGIRPRSIDGRLDYPLVEGRFLSFCNKARERSGSCVMIIDEINRAELSRVFGELMYVLEDSNRQVTLASGDQFSIPENVFILGTMNTADRSIAVVDHALRRRFAFIPLFPDYKVLRAFHDARKTGAKLDGLIAILHKVNKEIDDRRYEIGVSFFMDEQLADHLEDIWTMEIEPYLEEYFFDRPEVVDNFRWEKIRTSVLS